MMQRHHTFPSDDGMAFSFFDGKVVIHSKMGITGRSGGEI